MAAAQLTLRSDVLEQLSCVQPCGASASSHCGYCGRDGSASYGMIAQRMTCTDYQALIDRGWRRSGTWLYLPNNEIACCQLHPIRLDVAKFKPDKQQLKVLSRLDKYLAGEVQLDGTPTAPLAPVAAGAAAGAAPATVVPPKKSDALASDRERATLALRQAITTCFETSALPPLAGWSVDSAQFTQPAPSAPSNVHAATSVALQLAGLYRRAGAEGMTPQTVAAAIAAALTLDPSWATFVVAPTGFINVTLMHPPTVVAEAPMSAAPAPAPAPAPAAAAAPAAPAPAAVTSSKKPRTDKPGSDKHELVIEMVPSAFRQDEFQLYKRYQVVIHNDTDRELTAKSYTRFLVDSPLMPEGKTGPAATSRLRLNYSGPLSSMIKSALNAWDVGEGPGARIPLVPTDDTKQPEYACELQLTATDKRAPDMSLGFGSFHQRYLLDGKLIAVGVVDVLPQCLSSVYMFYDPDLKWLTLGKLTALAEIHWVQQARKACPRLQYYYLGFYTPDCVKMRYKAEYRPSDLFCRVSAQWVEGSVAIARLKANGRAPFGTTDPEAVAKRQRAEAAVLGAIASRLPLSVARMGMVMLDSLNARGQAIVREALAEWWPAVGPTVGARCVVQLQ